MSHVTFPKKKKKRVSIASIICITLIVVMCLGMLSSVAGDSSSRGTISSGGNKKPVSSIPSLDGEEVVINPFDLVINKSLYTPSDATVISELSFGEGRKYDKDYISANLGAIPELSLTVGGTNNMDMSSDNGYFKFSLAENLSYSNGFFSIRTMQPGSSDLLNLQSYKYVTLDFDLWSDTTFPEKLSMYFKGRSALDETNEDSYPLLRLHRNDDGEYVLDGRTIDVSKPIHITFIIESVLGESNQVLTYVNGEFFSSSINLFAFTYLNFFQFYSSYWSSGESISVDNIQMLGYSSGSSYGGINECFNDNTIKLETLPGSVLYVSKNEE